MDKKKFRKNLDEEKKKLYLQTLILIGLSFVLCVAIFGIIYPFIKVAED